MSRIEYFNQDVDLGGYAYVSCPMDGEGEEAMSNPVLGSLTPVFAFCRP